MNNYTLINKKIIPTSEALISVKQRGFRFGDGVFETIKLVNGRIYDYQTHEKRLKNGLLALQIEAETNYLPEKLQELIEKNQIKDGILRLSISRGEGSMGYLPQENIESLIIAEIIDSSKISYPNHIKIGISDIKTPKRPEFLQKCKTSQAINYILTKINAKKSGNFDDIILSEKNYVAETSSFNIFWVKNGKIYTPSLKCDILPGTIREKIIKNFKIYEVEKKLKTLMKADEIFLTNSNALVLMVDEIIFTPPHVRTGHVVSLPNTKNISQKILNFIKDDIKKQCY